MQNSRVEVENTYRRCHYEAYDSPLPSVECAKCAEAEIGMYDKNGMYLPSLPEGTARYGYLTLIVDRVLNPKPNFILQVITPDRASGERRPKG